MRRSFAQAFSHTRIIAGALAALWVCGTCTAAQEQGRYGREAAATWDSAAAPSTHGQGAHATGDSAAVAPSTHGQGARATGSSAAATPFTHEQGARATAQDWSAPARELADQLRRQIPPPARLDWSVQNRSTLSEDELRAIRRTIGTELGSAGYRAGESGASAGQVRISVSENFQNYLWVAEVLRGETSSVMMVAVPRAPAAPPHDNASLVISRKLLLAREEPILDLAMIAVPEQAAPRLLVLGSASVGVYEMSGASWQAVRTAPVAAVRVWPRDLRGRLVTRADGTFETSLPGERCLGSVSLLANLDCHTSDEPWPLTDVPEGDATARFVADRNYFTGPVVVPDNPPLPVPDFYTAVAVQNGKDSAWLVATTEGPARLLGRRGDVVEFQGWGSELAAIKSTCGSGTLVLATRSNDFAAPDAVQAFQLRGRAAEPASAPVEFTGPVTLLHASREVRSSLNGVSHTLSPNPDEERPEEGVAFAVVHALPTGLYEAYRLSMACGE
jgi:hypothetical protein